MLKATQSFIDTLEAKNVKYKQLDTQDDGSEVVKMGWNLKDTSIDVLAIFDDEHTVAIRCFSFIHASDEKKAALILACNEMNAKKRWVKFYIDKDNDLNIEDDAIIEPATAGEEVFELVLRMCQIAESVYPEFMRAMWT